jgi:hypothetical protein
MTGVKITPMNERRRAHTSFFMERFKYWQGLKRDYWMARMLAARDADQKHPLRGLVAGANYFY